MHGRSRSALTMPGPDRQVVVDEVELRRPGGREVRRGRGWRCAPSAAPTSTSVSTAMERRCVAVGRPAEEGRMELGGGPAAVAGGRPAGVRRGRGHRRRVRRSRGGEDLAPEVGEIRGGAPHGFVHPPQLGKRERLVDERVARVEYSSFARTRSMASATIVAWSKASGGRSSTGTTVRRRRRCRRRARRGRARAQRDVGDGDDPAPRDRAVERRRCAAARGGRSRRDASPRRARGGPLRRGPRPASTKPPGSAHLPRCGAMPRRTSRTCSESPSRTVNSAMSTATSDVGSQTSRRTVSLAG